MAAAFSYDGGNKKRQRGDRYKLINVMLTNCLASDIGLKTHRRQIKPAAASLVVAPNNTDSSHLLNFFIVKLSGENVTVFVPDMNWTPFSFISFFFWLDLCTAVFVCFFPSSSYERVTESYMVAQRLSSGFWNTELPIKNSKVAVYFTGSVSLWLTSCLRATVHEETCAEIHVKDNSFDMTATAAST